MRSHTTLATISFSDYLRAQSAIAPTQAGHAAGFVHHHQWETIGVFVHFVFVVSGPLPQQSLRRRDGAMSMHAKRAREILDSLLHGVDPTEDRDLSIDSVLQDPDVLRALLAAIEALNDSVARASRRSQLPRNIGRSWSPKEHEELLREFGANKPLAEIAASHGRTLRAIEARLQKAGLITAAERQTEDRFASQDSQRQSDGSISRDDVGVADKGGEPSSK